MEKKKMKLLPFALWLIFVLFTIAGLAVFSLDSASAKEKKAEEANCPDMQAMNKCSMRCVKNCQSNMDDISSAIAVVKETMDFLEKGDVEAAKESLEKADKILNKLHKDMKENLEKMPCANTKCPVERNQIDRMNTSVEQTRMYKGSKIGFCCASCPTAWDKMKDDEKDEKLKNCMPPKD